MDVVGDALEIAGIAGGLGERGARLRVRFGGELERGLEPEEAHVRELAVTLVRTVRLAELLVACRSRRGCRRRSERARRARPRTACTESLRSGRVPPRAAARARLPRSAGPSSASAARAGRRRRAPPAVTSRYWPPTMPSTPVARASSPARRARWRARPAGARRRAGSPRRTTRRRRGSRRPRHGPRARSGARGAARRRPSPGGRRGSASRCG